MKIQETPATAPAWAALRAGRAEEALQAFGHVLNTRRSSNADRGSALLGTHIAAKLSLLGLQVGSYAPSEISEAIEAVSSREFFLFEGMDCHLEFLHDKPRTLAYEKACEAVIQPGEHVLEIGTGSGILALIAARAGAQLVSTAEKVRWVAAAARRVMKDNATVGSRVQVYSAASQELWTDVQDGRAADARLPSRAHVLLSEIVGNELVDEGMLGSLRDALSRLCQPSPGKTFRAIPARGRLIAAAIDAPSLAVPVRSGMETFGTAYGFQFKAMNQLLAAQGERQPFSQSMETAEDSEEEELYMARSLSHDVVDSKHWKRTWISKPATLFELDLSSPDTPLSGSVSIPMRTTKSGALTAIMVWVELDMDAAGTIQLSSAPRVMLPRTKPRPARATNWSVRSCPVNPPVAVYDDAELVLHATYVDGEGVDVAVTEVNGLAMDAYAKEHAVVFSDDDTMSSAFSYEEPTPAVKSAKSSKSKASRGSPPAGSSSPAAAPAPGPAAASEPITSAKPAAPASKSSRKSSRRNRNKKSRDDSGKVSEPSPAPTAAAPASAAPASAAVDTPVVFAKPQKPQEHAAAEPAKAESGRAKRAAKKKSAPKAAEKSTPEVNTAVKSPAAAAAASSPSAATPASSDTPAVARKKRSRGGRKEREKRERRAAKDAVAKAAT